ncbi:caspase family protein [Tumebacillus lipolyticus]|uniref:Caspase domain-containing protein n=1 Tax=Tumebacillus lipolyticus TaxID=1280370 RepID=A0ABW4ZX16_9BACL
MRKALVVGINNYPTAPLYGCVNDAVNMQGVLRKNGDGSPNFDVKLLVSDHRGDQLKKAELKEQIEALFQGDSEVALLYFSGHGLVNSTGGYIVTSDYSRYDEGISMDDILIFANNSNAKNKVIIFDCCHSGAFGSPALAEGRLAQLSDGLTILTASKSSEVAMERGGSGVFTSLLIDALDGGAADLRGYITPGSLYSYVDEALGAWDQRPIFKTNVSRFVQLRRVKPPISLEVLREITNYFPSPEHHIPLDPTYEFTEEGHVEENVKIFKDLQKMESVGLVVPVDEEHMYFAAMNSKGCRLTALGYQYWRLVKENKI